MTKQKKWIFLGVANEVVFLCVCVFIKITTPSSTLQDKTYDHTKVCVFKKKSGCYTIRATMDNTESNASLPPDDAASLGKMDGKSIQNALLMSFASVIKTASQ